MKTGKMAGHLRVGVAVLVGLAAWAAASFAHLPGAVRILIGWDVGAALYLGLIWRLFLTESGPALKAKAEAEDEPRWGILAIIVAAILASLVAIVAALIDAKHGPVGEKALAAGLAGLTLILSWCTLQSVFALHYAHRHFQTLAQGGQRPKAFKFPGEPAKTYMDFVYLSFCIGATFQVSDTSVETAGLRNLITAHGAIAYFYNTTILALGINIIAGLVG